MFLKCKKNQNCQKGEFWVLVNLRKLAALAGKAVSFAGLGLNVRAKQGWGCELLGYVLPLPLAKNQARTVIWLRRLPASYLCWGQDEVSQLSFSASVSFQTLWTSTPVWISSLTVGWWGQMMCPQSKSCLVLSER